MDDYLSKPFTSEQLRKMLGTWLSEKRASDLGKQPVASPAPVPTKLATESPKPVSAPVGTTDLAELDQTVLDQIRQLEQQSGRPILGTVIQKFLDGYNDSTAAVQTAIAERDAKGLFAAAHFMKSGYANLGATTMVLLCKALEEIGREGQIEDAAALSAEFIQESRKVQLAFEQMLEQEVHV